MMLWSLMVLVLAADPAEEGHRPAVAPLQVADLRVTVGKSTIFDYPADMARISTSDPAVADAVPATLREFLVHGKSHGSATIVVWANNGQRTL
jgi:Flp pilus assembly secretin CpaC